MIQAQPGVREAEVFVAANGVLLTRLNYTSHIPSNGVEEPKSSESHGIAMQVVFQGTDGVTIGFGYEPGDITISPPGMPIAYRWNGPNRGILMELDLDALPAPIEIKPLFAGKDPLITHLALALRDELQAGNPGGRIYGEMLGAALKAHFVRKHAVFGPRRSSERRDIARDRMAAVLEYISAHLHAPISLMHLAAVADVSVFHFAHAFRRRMGMPPHQYVLRKRIELAISLMRNPEESIVDIALRCGFSSQSHLATVFRRITGTTPAAYRARIGPPSAPP